LGFEFYWVVSDFLFERAVGKLAGRFTSSDKLLFRFAITSGLSKNLQIHYLMVVRSCTHKEIFNYSGMTH